MFVNLAVCGPGLYGPWLCGLGGDGLFQGEYTDAVIVADASSSGAGPIRDPFDQTDLEDPARLFLTRYYERR